MEETKVVEGAQAAAPEMNDDLAKFEALEAEKAQLIIERDNYKKGMLKAKGKLPEESDDTESVDEKMRRIAEETLAESRLTQLAMEQDVLLKKALKENRELKLASINKTASTATTGTHTEGYAPKDTLLSATIMEYGKKRGWTDKDFENYKRNLARGR